MLSYVLRRLVLAVFTVFGVMVLTFLLFRGVAGDVAAAHVGAKATAQQLADWRHRHGYDRPMWVNLHAQLTLTDRTGGDARPFAVREPAGSNAAEALALIPSRHSESRWIGRYVFRLDRGTPLKALTEGERLKPPAPAAPPLPQSATAPASVATTPATQPARAPAPPPPAAALTFELSDGSALTVGLDGVGTAGELIDRINHAPGNDGDVRAGISDRAFATLFESQFFDHLYTSVTFQARSLVTNRKLTEIIYSHAPYSLALTVPAMVIGWGLALVISSVVAYYRGTIIDRLGVFLSVLGMCVPFLAYMIYGQWLMFEIAPRHAYGVFYRSNLYVPITIMVFAGLGSSVRFYRTVILDEVNRDYVRTARAKGAPLRTVLFRHVLKNCMLPILTNLILAIPLLILGSLLVEQYFGIPGLGDLLLTSIQSRDEPILNAMVFLTALIYTVGLLITDISYAVFDPRIRLR